MKNTGIVRKVDELGRVVLPVELRQLMGIERETRLEIRREGQTVVIKKLEDYCVFCGNTRKLTTYKAKKICAECLTLLPQEL